MTPVDDEARRRRIRRGVGFGVPALVCSVLVLLLGLPWWVLTIFLAIFAVLVIGNS